MIDRGVALEEKDQLAEAHMCHGVFETNFDHKTVEENMTTSTSATMHI